MRRFPLVNTCVGCYAEIVSKKKLTPVEWGREGGKVRASHLTPDERSREARKAALARWEATPKTERQEAARKAVLTRWAREKAKMASNRRK